MATKMDAGAVDAALADLNHGLSNLWRVDAEKLHKTFEFNDFVEAFGFMSHIALAAQEMGHHPEWFNVYKTVDVHLATHDVGGISEKDFTLAQKMEDYAA